PKHLDIKIRYADCKADEFGAPLLGKFLDIISVCCEIIDQKPPTIHSIDRKERGSKARMINEIKSCGTIMHPGPEIGLEENVYALVDVLLADHAHAELRAKAALGAIRRDHVLRPHARLVSIAAVDNLGCDACFVLYKARNLGIKAQCSSAKAFCVRAQHRLEVVLGAHAVASRAQAGACGARAGGHTALDL